MARASADRTPTLFDLGEDEPEVPQFDGPFVQVALNRPVRTLFTYRVPEGLRERAQPGSRVAVPFGSTRQVGVVVRVDDTSDVSPKKLRAILDVLDAEPIVDAELLGLTEWIADTYAAAWGEALAAVLPATLKRESGPRQVLAIRAVDGVGREQLDALEARSPKQHRLLRTLLEMEGRVELRDLLRQLNLSDSPARTLARHGLVVIERIESLVDPLLGDHEPRARPERLSPHQATALDEITASVDAREHQTFLLEGITGSGKTEVYLRAIEHAVAAGRSAIVLVPEIALTPQTVGWFRSRFDDVAVLHSRMTDAQRLAMWLRLKRGEARVVVGARSAIFAPVSDLGVIVVDEEHEPSFKQGSTPRYHARDVAVERARRSGAVCILGSATPSLESWRKARAGVFRSLVLPERVGGGAVPNVHVVDMRLEKPDRGAAPLFSRLLKRFLTETIEAKEQAILFLNRRGFVPVMWCPGCELTVRCDQCSMSLTFHRRINRLVCHGCCDEHPVPNACPTCTRPGLRFLGVGSERVESELKRMVAGVRVRRMDSDTMRRREDYEETLDAFGRREFDVLVGTQMIAKGLDFPRVTLVGIVAADQALHLPDFRAAERTYQLIAQVAGRAGRGELPGRIVVQTIAPEHPAITMASRSRFEDFARREDTERAELGYPPHGRLIRIVFDDEDESRVKEAAERYADELRGTWPDAPFSILGPMPAPIALLRRRHRHHILIKAPGDDDGQAARLFAQVRDRLADLAGETHRPRVAIDVDPVSLL